MVALEIMHDINNSLASFVLVHYCLLRIAHTAPLSCSLSLHPLIWLIGYHVALLCTSVLLHSLLSSAIQGRYKVACNLYMRVRVRGTLMISPSKLHDFTRNGKRELIESRYSQAKSHLENHK
jgi:hypothetical protein